jgi:hypothetical protein
MVNVDFGSPDSIACDSTLDDGGSIPGRDKGFLAYVQTSSEAHTASYAVGPKSFPWG